MIKKKANEVPKIKEDKPLKQLVVSFGITVNMGDYESARIDVSESEWTTEVDKEATYKKLWKSVESQVRSEIDKVAGEDQTKDTTKKKKRSR